MTQAYSSPAAIIFDLDGTLADTKPVWRAAEDRLFDACGSPWDATIADQFIGMNAHDLAATVHRLLQPDLSLHDCQTLMRDSLIDAYRDGAITAIPGAIDLVHRLHGHLPLVVASGSPLPGIRRCLHTLGLADCFHSLVTSEDVPRGKPHPDVFLHAARQLTIKPTHCLVFEDSLVGTQAAVAAGMPVIVRPQLHPDRIAAIATRVVDSWDEVHWPHLI